MQERGKNRQKELEALIKENALKKEVPTLLLHSCCGPCSSYVLEYLSAHFRITLFYYNPNIFPQQEYEKRVQTQKELLAAFSAGHPITLIEGKYEPERFFGVAKGLEEEREGGKRCAACFRLRLEESAKMAAELGCDYFSTTLSVSPHKDAKILGEISEKLVEEYGVNDIPADFKKKGGYLRSIELSKLYGLYRQEYCGCLFSKEDESKNQYTM